MNGNGKNLKKGVLSRILAFVTLGALMTGHTKGNLAGGSSGAYRARFNLGSLPPAWKGKRMRRILRGGK